MLTVILSAGKSTRLTHDGFPHQKCLLRMPNGQTLLEWQCKTVPNDKILYVSRIEYQKDELTTIIRVKAKYDLRATWIKKVTRGPLDGLWYIRKFLNLDEPLLILYNDELIEPEIMSGFISACENGKYDSGVVCFDNADERFSRIPGEKSLACGCTYYFKSGRAFVKAMKGMPRKTDNGVPDIVYSFDKWLPFFLGVNEYAELGTAHEYKTWVAQQGMVTEQIGF